MSAVAHYIAGVLPWDAMVRMVDSLSEVSDLKPGDRVKTMRGTLHGIVVRILEDGRLVWKPDNTAVELTALPESLCRDD
jgi:preprotein translocase subunit YajC